MREPSSQNSLNRNNASNFQGVPSLMTVLIVDDSEFDRFIYIRYLQSDVEASYRILEAETLGEGLELWRSQQPDLVLLDLNLPDGDGLEFLEAISTDQLINKLPAIVLTGQGDERIAVRAMKLGASDYLIKDDLTAISFLTCINQVKENSLLLQQLRRSQQQQTVISSTALHIRRAFKFGDVSNEIVQSISHLLGADRTLIYRFNPDMSGEIVAEAVISPWESCFDIQIEDTCFRENLGGEYQKGNVFAAHDIYDANLTECHIELLERFQVRANLVVPILLNGTNSLWGLLVVHQCSAPRQWHEEDIQLLHQLSVHLAIALKQAELYQNLENLNSSLEEKVEERTQEIQLQAQMLEQIHDAIISTTLDGTILTWNTGAERLYEYKSNEAIGQNVSMLYLNEDLLFKENQVITPLLEKGTHEVELRNQTKSGKIIYVSLRLSLARDGLGNPIRLIGCSNDISDRKQAELELRKSESRFRQLFESDVVGTLTANFQGQITDANDLFLDMLGYTRQELESGLIFWDKITPPEYVAQDFKAMAHLMQHGTIAPWEKQYYRKDGSRVSVLIGAVVLSESEDQTVCIAVDISDRKLAEQELQRLNQELESRVEQRTALLKESEQRFVTLAEAAPVGIFQTDEMGQTIYVNPAWGDITGRTPETALGLGWIETIHPEDRERILRESSEGIERLRSFHTEARCLKPDGTIVWFYCQVNPKLDSNNNILGYIGTLTDITARKLAEAELQKLSNRLELALRSAAIGCWEWDLVNNIKVWDARMFEIYGLSEQNINLMNYERWVKILHPDDLLPTTNLLQQAILGQAEYVTEFRVLHPDDTIHFIKAYGAVVRDAQGNPQAMIGINLDISDRKRIEFSLTESEAKFRRLVEGANDLIWSTDAKGIFDYLSPQFQTIFGFAPNDWIGKPFIDLVYPEERDWMTSRYIQTIQSGQTVKNAEFRHLHQEGHYIWVSVNTTPIINSEGIVIGSQGTLTDINDRKQAEKEILENQWLIQQIADSSPNVLYLYDLEEQRNTYANREILDTLGYSAIEIQEMGASWLPTVIHPDDLFPTLEHFERLKMAEDGEVFSHEYRFRHANGEWRYFYSRDLIFSRDAQGQVKQIIGTAQDITDRKNAEAALKASNQRWQFALEGAGDGIWDWNSQIDEVFFSRQWKAMLGYADDEIENRFQSWENLVHPDDLAQCHEDINKCLNHETLFYENEHRLRCKDGSYKWILARGKVIEWDADGRTLRMIGTHTDLSDRKRAALELQQVSERLTLAIKSGAIGCWDWNSDDNSIYWDDRMYEIYGVTKQSDERLTYNTWLNTLHLDDLATTEALIERAALGISDYDTEFRIVRPDGSICFIKAYGVVIRDSLGNIQGMIGINFDISDRKQAEAKLQQINEELLRATKLKDEFLANMSHELRTPLNAILGLSNALREQILGSLNEKQTKAIATVESSGEHLLSLINDILDLSKISSGMMELTVESVSVNNLCSSSLVFVKQQAFQKGVEIVSKIPNEINNIKVEERRIRQVLINLLTNAVKFTPSGGQVSLLVAVGQGDAWQGEATIPQQFKIQNTPTIVFQVVDTGIGIASKDLQRLFQPFVQVSSSLNRQYEGTGLGLALVKQIVELHGGQVMAESEVGKGSYFTVALPYEIAPSTSESKRTSIALSPPEIKPDNAIAPLILLAEDNEANIQTFTSYLSALDYRVIIAKNGEEAVSMAKANSPDTILMDIQMPDMDGLEAIRLIRADKTIAATPIIALTAFAMEGDHEKCLEAGANEYLTKPIKFKQLNHVIQQVLALYGKRQQS